VTMKIDLTSRHLTSPYFTIWPALGKQASQIKC